MEGRVAFLQGVPGPPGPKGAARSIALHDTTYGPVGLWQLQSSLADSSGNAYTLAVDSGTAIYAPVCPGVLGIVLGAFRAGSGTGANLLRIVGDITIECILTLTGTQNDAPFVTFTAGSDDTSSIYNYLYQVQSSALALLTWFSEYGTGLDQYFVLTEDGLPPKFQPFHFAVTRTSDVIRFYINGRRFGPASGTLITPDGGSASQLWIGGQGGIGANLCGGCRLSSLKIIPGALTAAQIRAEFNRTLGRFYGPVYG